MLPWFGAAVGQPVDQPRVGMEGKADWLVLGEKLVEIQVAQPVRVLGEAIFGRHDRCDVTFSHLACWWNLESTMWMNAS